MGTNGAIAGGTGRLQLSGCSKFVIGAEGELWGSTLAGSTSRFLGGEGGGTYIFRTKSNFGGDVAARFGFAFDRVLLFSKVGVAWADYQFSVSGPFA